MAQKKGTVKVMSRGRGFANTQTASSWNWVSIGVVFSVAMNLSLGFYSLGSQATSIETIKTTVSKHDQRWEDYNRNNISLAQDIATLKSNAIEIKDTLKRLESLAGKK